MTRGVRTHGRRTGVALVAAAVAWGALRLLAGRTRRVRGASMRPTLREGDLVLTVPPGRLRRGDVVVVRDPRRPQRETVKRVVGLPGDVVDLSGEPARVPPGRVAIQGDNAGASTDSRHYGAVGRAHVVSRVAGRLWPPGRP